MNNQGKYAGRHSKVTKRFVEMLNEHNEAWAEFMIRIHGSGPSSFYFSAKEAREAELLRLRGLGLMLTYERLTEDPPRDLAVTGAKLQPRHMYVPVVSTLVGFLTGFTLSK